MNHESGLPVVEWTTRALDGGLVNGCLLYDEKMKALVSTLTDGDAHYFFPLFFLSAMTFAIQVPNPALP